MKKKSGTYQIDHFIELALKHRWYLIISFCLSMVVGIILIFVLPKIYEASTLILVRPQSVPTDYVQSIVSTDIESRILTESHKILSRTNLEKIINQFNLFMEPEQENMYMEDKVASLRGRIIIAVQESAAMKYRRGYSRTDQVSETFSISFSGKDPEQVARVVNGLAAFFIEENYKVREAQAMDTSTFLEDELQPMRFQLESVEQKIRKFRNTHMGELPEQLVTNLRMLDQLQMQLDNKKVSLRSATDSLSILESQSPASQDAMEPMDRVIVRDESGKVLSLTLLKQQLAAAQASYTDRHPDVIRLKQQIADLEAKIASGKYKITSRETLAILPNREDINVARFYNEVTQKQDTQMRQRAELKSKIQSLKIEIAHINNQIDEYQRRVENTPVLEQELQLLQRDYLNIQGSYNFLLKRKMEADIAVNMEKKQKGEQFQIIDRARVPRNPASPNLKAIFVIAVFLGVNLGGGLIFLKDYFDTSLGRSEDIERELGISVLATIPKICYPKDYRKRMLRKVMTASSLFIATCLFAGLALLAFIGPETTIEMIRELVGSQTV